MVISDFSVEGRAEGEVYAEIFEDVDMYGEYIYHSGLSDGICRDQVGL